MSADGKKATAATAMTARTTRLVKLGSALSARPDSVKTTKTDLSKTTAKK